MTWNEWATAFLDGVGDKRGKNMIINYGVDER